MSDRAVMVMRTQPQPAPCHCRSIVEQFTDIPAFPVAISDDAGNTYRMQAQRDDAGFAVWFTTEERPPTRITLTFANGDVDVRPV